MDSERDDMPPVPEVGRIGLAHGNGGRRMRELIDGLFARHLRGTGLDTTVDAARLQLGGDEILMTTDGFTVQPLEFPGGDIGSLAVYGTVNDLAVCGARPRYLSLGVIAEEGLDIACLERIIASAAAAARLAGVRIATGDTKVVRRGEGGGLYLTTAGVGLPAGPVRPGLGRIATGDRILVSGPVGDHGVAVMLAREQFGLRGEVRSDAASVLPLAETVWDLPGLRFMRDPTRGGLATVAHEIAAGSGLGVRLREDAIPVRTPVRAVCEILGYDPLYLACEGRIVAVVAAGQATEVLARWRRLPQGREAAVIGEVTPDGGGVILETALGGERLLDELEDDPLPRIC